MDPFSKVNAGDPLRIPAAAWNRLMDHVKQDMIGGRASNRSAPIPTGWVWVRNDTQTDYSRFQILQVTGNVFDPSNDPAWTETPTLVTGQPQGGSRARIVVLQEPIAAGGVGLACIAGFTPCRVNIANLNDTHAYHTHLETSRLTSGACGWARIISRELQTTGEQWCYVELGAWSEQPFWALIESGSSSEAVYSYTEKEPIGLSGMLTMADKTNARTGFAWLMDELGIFNAHALFAAPSRATLANRYALVHQDIAATGGFFFWFTTMPLPLIENSYYRDVRSVDASGNPDGWEWWKGILPFARLTSESPP